MGNNGLITAKKSKSDEFYTQLADIEKELRYYGGLFYGKVVYCNCDNPVCSNFWRYFDECFDVLGLTGLVSTYYDEANSVYRTEVRRDCLTGRKSSVVTASLCGNGDFRSAECVDILEACDIVVTNPPFSLFREYIAQLMSYHKKFLIIGNMNAVTYKDVFPFIKDNSIWYGASISSGDREFGVPDGYPLLASGSRIDGFGRRYIRVKGVRWFTNLDHVRRHAPLALSRSYYENPEAYPEYDGYQAINVGRTADIPYDYDGVMGVPISFLDKYCPEQFEIIGLDRYVPGNPCPGRRFTLNGKEIYARILIRRKN